MMTERQEPLRVLIFHIRISMGHERAAQALSEAFRRRVPHGGLDARLVEAIGHSSGWLAPVVCNSYLSIIKYVPPLWDFLYDDPRAGVAGAPLLRYWTRRSQKNFLTMMAEFRPHVVICTQALPARILAQLKAWGYGTKPGMSAPVFAVVTDFGIHRYWAADEIDGYFVPTDSEFQRLVSMGVPAGKIVQSGIPIHPDIAVPVDDTRLAEARRTMGLERGRISAPGAPSADVSDIGRPTLLLMGGSRGMGLSRNLLRCFEQLPIPVNILASAGTNPLLLDVFHRWAAESKHRVVPLSYRADIRTLYALSDVAITKPGGLTVAECMAVGLPMVIPNALPGQERHNLEFVRGAGLGEIGTSAEDVVARVGALLMDPARRVQMTLRLKSHARPGAAFAVVDHVLARLFEKTPSFAEDDPLRATLSR